MNERRTAPVQGYFAGIPWSLHLTSCCIPQPGRKKGGIGVPLQSS